MQDYEKFPPQDMENKEVTERQVQQFSYEKWHPNLFQTEFKVTSVGAPRKVLLAFHDINFL